MLAARTRPLALLRTQVRTKYYKYSKRIHCEPPEIYSIVSDVSSYKEFVPYVAQSFHTMQAGDSSLTGTGGLVVDWTAYREEFTCDLEMVPDKSVVANTDNGLFDKLHCEWRFEPVEARFSGKTECLVTLVLDYEFKNVLYNRVSGLFQNKLSEIMMKAFERRLAQVRRERRSLRPVNRV